MRLAIFFSVISVLLLCVVATDVPVNSQTDAVPEGEPLHLYIRRQPVQDMTYLYFHPPDDIYSDRSRDDLTYRKTLLQKGSGNDSVRMFFPQDPNNNFLQFEPNATLQFTYNFVISAVRPLDTTDMTYRLNVLIEMDMERDGDYESPLSFEITGEADSRRSFKNGTVPVDAGSLKSFDGEKGGRLRVTISRKDYLDTSLTIYCGYQDCHSWFQLPYSKFKYVSDEDGDGPATWPYVLGIAAVVAIGGAVYLYFRSSQKKGGENEEGGRRGKR